MLGRRNSSEQHLSAENPVTLSVAMSAFAHSGA